MTRRVVSTLRRHHAALGVHCGAVHQIDGVN
jgi:hypothetical protein